VSSPASENAQGRVPGFPLLALGQQGKDIVHPDTTVAAAGESLVREVVGRAEPATVGVADVCV